MGGKNNLGKKHECPKCSCKFYDLGNKKAVCPKCKGELSLKSEDKRDEGRLIRDILYHSQIDDSLQDYKDDTLSEDESFSDDDPDFIKTPKEPAELEELDDLDIYDEE